MRPRPVLRLTLLGALVAALLVGPVPPRSEAVAAAPPPPTQGVRVTTVPAVAGVQLVLDGRKANTDARGVATFPTAQRREAGLRLKVVAKTVESAGVRATLERVYGTGPNITLAFATERPADFTFVTVGGKSVRPARIERMTMRSSVGDVIDDVPVAQTIWLRSSRVVSTQNGPQERNVQWSVEKVLVGGSNVVNRAEVRFEPATKRHVTVPLLFFTARVRVKDAFFGFSQRGTLEITRPDGVKVSRRIPPGGELVLPDQPRGHYEFTVVGPGVRLERPLVLSRDQELDLELLSWVDLAAVALVALVFGVVPLAVGRRRRRAGRTELAVGPGPSDPSDPSDGIADVARPHTVDDDQVDDDRVGVAGAGAKRRTGRARRDPATTGPAT